MFDTWWFIIIFFYLSQKLPLYLSAQARLCCSNKQPLKLQWLNQKNNRLLFWVLCISTDIGYVCVSCHCCSGVLVDGAACQGHGQSHGWRKGNMGSHVLLKFLPRNKWCHFRSHFLWLRLVTWPYLHLRGVYNPAGRGSKYVSLMI